MLRIKYALFCRLSVLHCACAINDMMMEQILYVHYRGKACDAMLDHGMYSKSIVVPFRLKMTR